jgi:hypothetical protein
MKFSAAIFAGHIRATSLEEAVFAGAGAGALLLLVDATLVAIGSFLSFGMTAARCFRSQMPIMSATLATTVVSTLIQIPHFGLIGAGRSLLMASLVRVAASYLVLDSAMNKQANVSGGRTKAGAGPQGRTCVLA